MRRRTARRARRGAVPLTGGNLADITAAATLVSAVTPPGELVGDNGYDANHLRRFLAERCNLRNVIERTFRRIKDVRSPARIARLEPEKGD